MKYLFHCLNLVFQEKKILLRFVFIMKEKQHVSSLKMKKINFLHNVIGTGLRSLLTKENATIYLFYGLGFKKDVKNISVFRNVCNYSMCL